jgi:hypothetical protein
MVQYNTIQYSKEERSISSFQGLTDPMRPVPIKTTLAFLLVVKPRFDAGMPHEE